jgi:preprotein translocase subunit YajC
MERKLRRVQRSIDCRMNKYNSIEEHQKPFRGDTAFFTQPGRFPARTRFIKREEKQMQLYDEIERLKDKAEAIEANKYHIKGDAERHRQKKREANDTIIHLGSYVNTHIYGKGTVKKINSKTYVVELSDGCGKVKVDKSFVDLTELEAQIEAR